MNINKLKPIPKYLERKILALDKQIDSNRRGLRFYAYITTIDKDIAKVTVALRNKGKVVQMKQVCVHALNDERAYVRDMEYNFLGISAYRVGWYDEGFKYRYNMRPYYNDGIWYNAPFKYYNPYAPIVNRKYVLKHERFKYSQADKYPCQHFIKYLRLYLQYPQIEYLVKAGLTRFIDSITILKKIDKDKHFAKWLLKNKTQLISMSPQDLIREGEVLHHCVGRMNYDQKFAKEQSLIFFLRDKSAPETPLVTMEYSPSQKRLLQCYGDHDSRPNEQIMQFVNEKWLPYANRKLNRLAA